MLQLCKYYNRPEILVGQSELSADNLSCSDASARVDAYNMMCFFLAGQKCFCFQGTLNRLRGLIASPYYNFRKIVPCATGTVTCYLYLHFESNCIEIV